MSRESKTLGVRMGISLYERIEGDNKSQAVRQILTMFYNGDLVERAEYEQRLSEMSEQYEQRLSDIREQVEQEQQERIEELTADVERLQERNQMLQYVVRQHEQTIEDLRNDKEVLRERLPPPRSEQSIWQRLKFWE